MLMGMGKNDLKENALSAEKEFDSRTIYKSNTPVQPDGLISYEENITANSLSKQAPHECEQCGLKLKSHHLEQMIDFPNG